MIDLLDFLRRSPSPYHAAESAADCAHRGGLPPAVARRAARWRSRGRVRGAGWRDRRVAHPRRPSAGLRRHRRAHRQPEPAREAASRHRRRRVAPARRRGVRRRARSTRGSTATSGSSGRVALRSTARGPPRRASTVPCCASPSSPSTSTATSTRRASCSTASSTWCRCGASGTPEEGAFAAFLADEARRRADDVVAWDVMLHDLTPPAILGVDGELIAVGAASTTWSSCVRAALAARSPDATASAARSAVLAAVRPRGGRQRDDHGRGGPAPRRRARAASSRRARRQPTRPPPRPRRRRSASRRTWPTRCTPTTSTATSPSHLVASRTAGRSSR